MSYSMFNRFRKIFVFLVLISSFTIPIIATMPVKAVDVLNPGSGCSAGSGSNTGDCGACNNPNTTSKPSFCPKNSNPGTPTNNVLIGPNGIITKAILILSFVVGILSVVMILISGFRFITSNGNPDAIAGARNTLIYALVGIGVAVLGVVIVEFVLSKV